MIIRGENEKHEDYKKRRKQVYKVNKAKLKPKVIWDSFRNGTYVRAKHGKLKK